jgi:iron complex outermembrane recepter protein
VWGVVKSGVRNWKSARPTVTGFGIAAVICIGGAFRAEAQTAPANEQTTPPPATANPNPAPTSAATPGPASRAAGMQLPAVQIKATHRKPVKLVQPTTRGVASPGPGGSAPPAPGTSASAAQGGVIPNAPLQQVPGLDKTGTKLINLPMSVTEIPKQLVTEQGGTTLRDSIRNSSGVSQGGPSSYGFFDRFLVRGLDARIYTDGLSDFDQINGLPHSLNGVDHVEILKGPGSALFGSGPPGGTINIVHALPTSDRHAGISTQLDSWGGTTTNMFATGPTKIPNLDYRVDGLAQHSDGFRGLKSSDYELRPQFNYSANNHITNVSLDVRHIEATPDPQGIIYWRPAAGLMGYPLSVVPRDTKYSSLYDHGNQDYARATVSDIWSINNILTINQRLTFAHRDLDILRNGDSGTVTNYVLSARSMRHQHDLDDDMVYQFEPVWKFNTGSIGHTLLTGFEYHDQNIVTHRETATLPNILNVFAPVIPDGAPAGPFIPNFKDDMHANYLGLYSTDQIDVTDRFKVRLGIRQDYWNTSLTPLVTIPGRTDGAGNPLLGGVTYTRNDQPWSWNVGALYHVTLGFRRMPAWRRAIWRTSTLRRLRTGSMRRKMPPNTKPA